MQMARRTMRVCSRFTGRGRALEHRGNTSRLRDARLARHEPGYGPDTRKDDERHDRDEDAHRGREHTRAFPAGAGAHVVLKEASRPNPGNDMNNPPIYEDLLQKLVRVYEGGSYPGLTDFQNS